MTVELIDKPDYIGVKSTVNGALVGNVTRVDPGLKPEIRRQRIDVMAEELRREYGSQKERTR